MWALTGFLMQRWHSFLTLSFSSAMSSNSLGLLTPRRLRDGICLDCWYPEISIYTCLQKIRELFSIMVLWRKHEHKLVSCIFPCTVCQHCLHANYVQVVLAWLGRWNDLYTMYTKNGPCKFSWTVSPPSRIFRHPGCPKQRVQKPNSIIYLNLHGAFWDTKQTNSLN